MVELVTGDPDACASVDEALLLEVASGIKKLVMAGRGITDLSANDFAGFSNLTHLDLSNNQITALPPEIFDPLTSLTHVTLNGNNLESLPDGLFDNNSNLAYVRLSENPGEPFELKVPDTVALHGAIRYDPAIGARADVARAERMVLELLYISTRGPNWLNNENWLSEKPLDEWYGVSVGPDGRVSDLILNRNRLEGSLPTRFGELTGLRVIELSGNRLYGSLPDLSAMAHLRKLDLANNRNPYMSEMGKPNQPMPEADRVYHRDENGFCGTIPNWMGELDELESLYLHHNNFIGTPPDISGVDSIDLASNRLNSNEFGWQRPVAGAYYCDTDSILYLE